MGDTTNYVIFLNIRVYYKSTVLPSMKKDKTYTVMCAIDMTSRGIVHAVCTCPAGTSESCVHVSALLHALECLYESPKNALLAGSAVGEPIRRLCNVRGLNLAKGKLRQQMHMI